MEAKRPGKAPTGREPQLSPCGNLEVVSEQLAESSGLEEVEVSAEIVERARTSGAALVVLPLRQTDGRGVYCDSTATLVKRLRAAGVDARFLDPPEQRTFEMKKTGLELLAAFAVGIASTAAWDGLKDLFKAHPKHGLSLTYVDIADEDSSRQKGLKADGDSASVLAALDKVLSKSEPQQESGGESRQVTEASPAITEAGSDDDLREDYRRGQILNRRAAAKELMGIAHDKIADPDDADAMAEAEEAARQALGLFARSLDWAEESPDEDEAHALMDNAGWWVRTTFGCQLGRAGSGYRQRCPVALAHNRIGLSVGGTAVRICSICGADFSECEHLPGMAYMVPGGPEPLGWCRVCLKEACEHEPGQQYRVSVIARITEMSVDEVSLVPKPANPECRILEMSILTSDLLEALGSEFVPGSEVSCDRCLYECGGLIKHDPAGWMRRTGEIVSGPNIIIGNYQRNVRREREEK